MLRYNSTTESVEAALGASPSWTALGGGGGGGSGLILQDIKTTDAAYASVAVGQVPYDDTIPQNTEGTELTNLATAITPAASGNKIEVEAGIYLASSDIYGGGSCSIFEGSTANAIGTLHVSFAGNGDPKFYVVRARFITSSTSGLTFKVRCGEANAGKTFYVNGTSSGRKYGGALVSYMRAVEID